MLHIIGKNILAFFMAVHFLSISADAEEVPEYEGVYLIDGDEFIELPEFSCNMQEFGRPDGFGIIALWTSYCVLSGAKNVHELPVVRGDAIEFIINGRNEKFAAFAPITRTRYALPYGYTSVRGGSDGMGGKVILLFQDDPSMVRAKYIDEFNSKYLSRDDFDLHARSHLNPQGRSDADKSPIIAWAIRTNSGRYFGFLTEESVQNQMIETAPNLSAELSRTTGVPDLIGERAGLMQAIPGQKFMNGDFADLKPIWDQITSTSSNYLKRDIVNGMIGFEVYDGPLIKLRSSGNLNLRSGVRLYDDHMMEHHHNAEKFVASCNQVPRCRESFTPGTIIEFGISYR